MKKKVDVLNAFLANFMIKQQICAKNVLPAIFAHPSVEAMRRSCEVSSRIGVSMGGSIGAHPVLMTSIAPQLCIL